MCVSSRRRERWMEMNASSGQRKAKGLAIQWMHNPRLPRHKAHRHAIPVLPFQSDSRVWNTGSSEAQLYTCLKHATCLRRVMQYWENTEIKTCSFVGFLLLLSVFKRQYVALDTSLTQKEWSNLFWSNLFCKIWMFLLDFSFNTVVTMTSWCKQLYHLVHGQGRGMQKKQTNISTSSFGHSRWTLLLPVDTTDWALASSRENVQSLQHTVSPNNEQRFLKTPENTEDQPLQDVATWLVLSCTQACVFLMKASCLQHGQTHFRWATGWFCTVARKHQC